MMRLLRLAASISISVDLTSFCQTTYAQTAQWVEVAQSQSGDKVFVDTSSVRIDNGIRPVKVRYKMNIFFNTPFDYVSTFFGEYRATCETGMQETVRVVTWVKDVPNSPSNDIHYRHKSEYHDLRRVGGPIKAVSPGSLGGTAFKYACSLAQTKFNN